MNLDEVGLLTHEVENCFVLFSERQVERFNRNLWKAKQGLKDVLLPIENVHFTHF